ncbi:alpha/beta hydrolase [Aquimarina addita]|uniref:Alpha/beta hydrolase n=1 Tax=Aquimarina addita TaxID=870485 RepID=A0ABP7XG28_9FLAO
MTSNNQEKKSSIDNPIEIVGNGKKIIVFIHHFGGTKDSWKWLTNKIDKDFRCILITLPGFGNTDRLKKICMEEFAIFINDTIRSLNLNKYILCGHSMGAKLALYAASLNKSHKPEKIILIAPSPPTMEYMTKEEKDRMLIHPNITIATETVKKSTIKKLSKRKFNFAISSQLQVEEDTWKWWLETGMNKNIVTSISSLKIPSYVICSSKDPVIDMNVIYNYTIPYVYKPSIFILTSVGHLIPLEIPGKLAKHITRVINMTET